MMTTNLNMNINLTLVNTLCIRTVEGFGLLDKFVE